MCKSEAVRNKPQCRADVVGARRGTVGISEKPPLSPPAARIVEPTQVFEREGCADCPRGFVGVRDETQLCVIAGSVESFQSGAAACPATGSHICVGFSRPLTAGCPTAVTHHCTINSKAPPHPLREGAGRRRPGSRLCRRREPGRCSEHRVGSGRCGAEKHAEWRANPGPLTKPSCQV